MAKLWMFRGIAQATTHYHPEGGLLVVAADEPAARVLVEQTDPDAGGWDHPLHYAKPRPTDEDWAAARVYELLGDPEPHVVIFPNAGCC